jgi:tetratricopeptide (TPR) repeat protein
LRQRSTTSSRAEPPELLWLAAAVLLAAGFAAYANAFTGPFVFDDVTAIVTNASLHALWPPHWLGADPGSVVSGRPVLNLTFAVNYALGGLDVRGYHAVNVAIHLLAGVALFGVVRRTLLSERMRRRCGAVATALAFAVALVWIVHPLNTEAVTYIWQRAESLTVLCQLVTLYCAIRGWRAAAVIACALAMGTKETAIVTPAIVVVWDYVFGADGATRRGFYLALTATIAIALVPMLGDTQGRRAAQWLFAARADAWTPASYLWTQAGVITHYLGLAFHPAPLVFDYADWPRAHSPLDVLPQLALTTALLAVTIRAVVKRRPEGFAGAVFFLVLAPTSSVLPIPTEIAAEHRMYLPLAAVAAIVLVPLLRAAGSRTVVVVLAAALAVPCIVLTRSRNADYASPATLWAATVAARPANVRARLSYGIELMRNHRPAETEAQMRAALPFAAEPATRSQVLLQLGAAEIAQGRADEGIASLEEALRLDPASAVADIMLGQAYAARGQEKLALAHLMHALDSRRDDVDLLLRSAWLLATAADPAVRDGASAVTLAVHAVTLTAERDPLAYETLAAAYAEADRQDEAVLAIDRALALSRARGDAAATALYEKQRATFAAGGKLTPVR